MDVFTEERRWSRSTTVRLGLRRWLAADAASWTVRLNLHIETEYRSVMDYFEIFLNRMTMCRRAAERLGLKFELVINDQKLV